MTVYASNGNLYFDGHENDKSLASKMREGYWLLNHVTNNETMLVIYALISFVIMIRAEQ